MSGIQFAIHTYGHGDAMFFVVNGIKMIMDSDFADSIIKLMALIATSYYALQGMAKANDGQVGYYFMRTAAMLIVITSLLMPKADILIIDRIGGRLPEKVDNLPYAFVLPVGALEAIGAGITSMFEQAFTPVSSASFKDYGMIFGQRMVQESRNWRISNPEFASNMNRFIKRCVVLEAMIGSKFTPNDVYSTDDIFELVASNAGTFRTVDLTINKKFARLTCKDAARELKNYMEPELNKLLAKYNNTDFGRAVADGLHIANPTFNQILAKNIELGYKSTFGVDYSAKEIVRQNMMIHAISDFNNAADLYGYRRASDMQKSNWGVMGDLAKENLPQFLTIIKALIYASFVFVVPMMILSGGIRHYLKYCVVVFSLQIWPALNAVLNLFVELYSKARLSGVIDGGISFASFNQAHDIVDTIVVMAAGLQMSIPFLSFAIVQAGVGSFIHLASTLQGASSNAASVASSELTSGNRSFDNINNDNQNMHNKSGFKTDLNPLHQERAMQVMRSDGSIEKTFADGSSSISSGAGINISSGVQRMERNNSKQGSIQQTLSDTLSAIEGDERHCSNAKTATINNVADLVSHMAERESKGKSFYYEKAGEEGKILQEAVNYTKQLNKNEGMDFNEAASASVKGYAELGVGLPDSVSFVNAKAGVEVDGSLSASGNYTQSTGKNTQVSEDQNTQGNFNSLIKAAENSSWMKDNNIDTGFSETIRASHDQMKTYQESLSQKREKAATYSEALNMAKTQGVSDSKDMYGDVEKAIMKEYGVSQSDAHKMIEIGDKRANKVWDNIIESSIQKDVNKIEAARTKVENVASTGASNFRASHEHKVDDANLQQVKQEADNLGLNKEKMTNDLSYTKQNLVKKNDIIQSNNQDKFNSTYKNNMQTGSDIEKQHNKDKDNRFGKAITSSIISDSSQLEKAANHFNNKNKKG